MRQPDSNCLQDIPTAAACARQVTMANFPPLLQLSRLELGATDVDYAGLVAIGALTSLQRLSLTDCQVSVSSRGTVLGPAPWL